MKPSQTRWPVVWVAFGAGILAATHIGKLPPALPGIRADLVVGFVMGGWIASVISLIGFAFGLIAGGLTDRIGLRRVLIFGLLALAAGSFLGAAATTGPALLFTRFVEGIGFAAATIAGAAIIARTTSGQDRKWALGIWAAYMPLGFAGMMLCGAAILEILGWRMLWIFAGVVSLVWAAVALLATAEWQRTQGAALLPDSLPANILSNLRRTGGVLVALCFGLYAAQHISMMNWLPTYMHEVYGAGTMIAAGVPALVLAFNAAGNYIAAWAMGRGAPIWLLLAAGAGGMALTELGIFSNTLPDAARLVLAFGFGVAGGLIPAATFAAVPLYAPTPAQIGAMNGLMVVGTNAGQLFGPPALAAARQAAGSWDGVLWLVVAMALAGAVLAVLSRRLERDAVDE